MTRALASTRTNANVSSSARFAGVAQCSLQAAGWACTSAAKLSSDMAGGSGPMDARGRGLAFRAHFLSANQILMNLPDAHAAVSSGGESRCSNAMAKELNATVTLQTGMTFSAT